MKRFAIVVFAFLLVQSFVQPTFAQSGIPTVGGPWWNTQWRYRLPVASGANGFARTNRVANFPVNFTTLLTSLGASGALNTQSIRVVEINGSGTVIDQNVVYQFDPDAAFNASTNALGTVVVMMNGTTATNAVRYFHIYFDTNSGFTLPSFSNQLTLTDNVSYAGQSSYQVDNQLGRLYYHKVGGGFAGMRDLNNVEWIGFDPTPGSHANGEYRGIPNMGAYAHPGYSNGSSTILSQGPIKITIQTVTTDGTNARWIWEFYPTFQTMTLQQTGVNYWLLYEGIPNGTLNQASGFVKNSGGQNLNLGSTFTGDLPGPEWAYFGQTGLNRFLYLAHHEDDNQVDHYRPFFDVGSMTILGFGRDGSSVNRYMSATPQKLTFGFGETESQSAQIMDNAFRDLSSGFGVAEQNASGPATISQQPTPQNAFVGGTATFTVGASGAIPLSYQWQRNNVNVAGATTSSYTTPSLVLGDNGSNFRCIVSNAQATVTSNSALLTVTVAPASFTSDDFSAATINTGLWTIVNPAAPSTIDLTGTGTSDALLRFQLPASSHDVWVGGNFAPRLMQNSGNVDFTAEVKFQSTLANAYQMQGIIVEQDANNYLRFDFLRTPGGLSTYSASFTAGNPTQRINAAVASSNPMWLRVNRTGNQWTMSYSSNGTTFTTAGTFTFALTVTKIGPFAGNAGSPSPATTVLVDYFFNTASPITPEDPVGPTPPLITTQPTNQTVTVGNTATFNVAATGTLPLAYQWQKNNVNIGGATNASYTTPATVQGDSGSAFRCIVSNVAGTVTSNSAILNVNPPAQPSTIVSDDFSSGVLNGSLWTYVNPLADATLSFTGAGTADALLNIALPATQHDLWTNGYQVPRIMQNANNVDFTAEAKFQSTLTAQFQSQGIVVEQDANNVLRLDIYYDGTNTNIFAASMIGGFAAPTIHVNTQIGAGAQNPAYMRINRTGNQWTLSYSFNGTTFTQAGTFSLPFTLTKIGVWAGNSGTNPAFTMKCDYFFNTASPINPEDPTGPPTPPNITQQPTNQNANEGSTATFTVAATGNPAPAFQWQRNNVDISGATNTSYTTPATVFATDNGATFRCVVSNSQGTVTSNSATLTVTQVGPSITQQPTNQTVTAPATATFNVAATGSPTLVYQWQKNSVDIVGATTASYTTPSTSGADNGATFRCVVSNSIGTVTSNSATLTVNAQPSGSIVSDDFSSGVLNNTLWTFTNPGTPSTLSFVGAGTTDAMLSIAIPAGGTGHDVWTGGNFAPRIMQNIGNGDFQAEVKFQSTMTAQYQMQGIIVEQDANTYLRFDFLRTNAGIQVFAASFTGGNPTQRISTTPIAGTNPLWLRVDRTGNSWTASYSSNGTTFTTAGTFTFALTVAKIGPFAGNAPGASSPAFTMLVDYFFNRQFPITPEDPTGPVITQQPTNQTVTVGNAATFNVTASGGLPLAYQWQKNNVNIGGATNASYTTPATVQGDSGSTFRCIVSNTFGTVTSNSAILNVNPPSQPSTIVSDDFSSGVLNGSLWTYVNPLADATLSFTGAGTADALLNIALPATQHDLWTNGYQVPRIMQNANDADFSAEAKFQSTLTAQFQSQGIVVEQDANNVLRLDIYYDGSNTNIFAASFIGGFGAPTIHVNTGIGAGPQNPAYMRINRAGNQWTLSYSFNGTTFTQAGTFSLPFTVTKIGVWAGNSGTNPAFTMKCDYFFNTASPINPEDPVASPTPPNITQQPTNQNANEGSTATFTVAATGNPAPTYQWQKNTVNIAGATNTSYTTPATVFATDNGATFRCIVSNSQGTVTSNSATLTVTQVGPSITQQPTNQTVTAPATATFNVAATGSPTLVYQWQKNTVDIVGATTASYTTPSTSGADNGATFRCVVSNSIGTVTSNSATLTVNTTPSGQPVSDDFSTGTLNNSLWTVTNPGVPSTISLVGTGTSDALLSIAIPGGSAHDLWTGTNQVPRIMQTIQNQDFTVEAKFQSVINQRYQIQGILVQQDANNFLRADFFYDGAGLRIFSATFVAGSPTVRINNSFAGGTNPVWLRVGRVGNTWTISTSTNGTTFTSAGSYSFAMTTSSIGVFGGNQGDSPATSPAFTMLCDYFFNTASPINPEDPTGPATGPAITQHPTNTTVDEGGRATFTVAASGSPLNYQWQKGGVNISGATSSSYTTPALLFADDASLFRCVVSNALGTSSSNSATLTVSSAEAVGINVWYGLNQSFGAIGDPIPYINILGHWKDPDGLGANGLQYKLNSGATLAAQTSADGRRLDKEGDFNLEIPRTSLNTGNNTVLITLTDALNNVTSKTVSVNYAGGGNSWPQTYSIDWSTVTNVQSVGQPADGFWAVDTNGVRVIKPGYDRIFNIGEQTTWSNYEVTFPFTVYSFTADAFGFPSFGPGIGVIMRWNGNTDTPLSGTNPKTGYLPLGGLGWYHWATNSTGNIQILDNNANVAAQDGGSTVTLGVRYNFKMKVFSSGVGQAPTYRIKIWPAGQAEPGSWSVSYTGATSDPSTGTLALIAQECDVNIGNVTITPTVNATRPIGGNDLIAMYRFAEGSGNRVSDVSGNGTPLDLKIANVEATSWSVDGLAINMPTMISSETPANKIIDAVKKSNEMTIEAWLKPTMVTFNTPSRFIGFDGKETSYLESSHALSADRSTVSVEAAMGIANADAINSTTSNTEYTHVVLTRNAVGTTTLFVNGVETVSKNASVGFENWKDASLVLGDEQNGWLGVYKFVAIYSRAMTAIEVKHFFDAGADPEIEQPVLSKAPSVAGGVMNSMQEVPKSFALYQNYPNPFNPSTTIKFDLPKDENVSLTVYNLLGQQVATLVNERRTAGSYNVQWNANGLASGVYVYRISAGDFVQTRKLMLLK